MLKVDPRAGSITLFRPLQLLGLPARKRMLKYGDISFRGNGPDGEVRVGMEYKRLSDLLACITDKRFVAHQLPGMCAKYQMRYLIIEGVIRPARDSGLEEFTAFRSRSGREFGNFRRVYARITYPALRRFLTTIQRFGRFTVIHTSSFADTVGFIAAEYGWWQKEWSSHHSHLALPAWEDGTPREQDLVFRRHTVFRRMMSTLPGIGFHRSEAVAAHFPSPIAAMKAPVSEWAAITTTDRNGKSRRLGEKTAKLILKAIHGRM